MVSAGRHAPRLYLISVHPYFSEPWRPARPGRGRRPAEPVHDLVTGRNRVLGPTEHAQRHALVKERLGRDSRIAAAGRLLECVDRVLPFRILVGGDTRAETVPGEIGRASCRERV